MDIEKECAPCAVGKISIQDFLKNRLPQTDAQIVFFDHGTGEIADFVTFTKSEDEITIGFYHCKGSDGSSPDERVDDAYEVCGQGLKSLIWTNERKLHDRIIYRNRTRAESSFLKGEKTELNQIFGKSRKIPIFFRDCRHTARFFTLRHTGQNWLCWQRSQTIILSEVAVNL